MKPTVKKIKNHKKIITIVIGVILVVVGAYFVLSASGYLDALKLGLQVQEQQKTSAENKIVLDKLKQIMLLPDDVTPNIVTISKVEELRKNQPGFFDNAKDGDSVIVYQDIAIIYDAKANKIIKIGPVLSEQPQQPQQPQQPTAQQPTAQSEQPVAKTK